MLTFGYEEDGLLSPCSLYHYLFGVFSYWLVLKFRPQWKCGGLVLVVAIHLCFEMWESSPYGIRFFEKWNHRVWVDWPDYDGDSILNSNGDTLCFILGCYSIFKVRLYCMEKKYGPLVYRPYNTITIPNQHKYARKE